MPTVTLSQLQTYVWDHLDNNSAFYPATQVTGALNEILRRLNLIVGLIQTSADIPGFSVSNQYLYNVPSGVMVPLRVYFEKQPLQPIALISLARRYQNFLSDNVSNIGPPARWAALGIKQFILHPADRQGGRQITVQGIAPMTPLVNAGDTVSLEDQFVNTVIKYSIARVTLKEGGKTFSDMQTLYQSMMADVAELSLWRERVFPQEWVELQEK